MPDFSDAWIDGEDGARWRSAARETTEGGPGTVVLVPAHEPHDVRNAGDDTLRFAAVYASTDVMTTYEEPVQPAGDRERSPIAI